MITILSSVEVASDNMNLTIFIPLLNSTQHLKKNFEYYTEINFKGNFLIVDSSSAENRKLNVNLIKKNKKLKIKYFKYNHWSMACLKKYFDHIKTDYFVFQGADDYYSLKGLNECIKFLNKNKSYSSCGGNGVVLNPYKNSIGEYNCAQNIENFCISRLKEHLVRPTYQLQFSVCRKSNLKKLIKFIPSNKNVIPEKGFHSEILFNLLLVISGKNKSIRFPYLIRLIGDYNDGQFLVKIKNYKKKINARIAIENIPKILTRAVKNQYKIKDTNLFKKINSIIQNKYLDPLEPVRYSIRLYLFTIAAIISKILFLDPLRFKIKLFLYKKNKRVDLQMLKKVICINK